MKKIGIIGLGYVGLPLAVEFGKEFETVGFDINSKRIQQLHKGIDKTGEVTSDELKSSTKLIVSSQKEDLADCNVYIVTVPTPIDDYKKPDLTPLKKASETVGKFLGKGNIVVYESTVYPGCTEEVCVPILEQESGLNYNVDFFCGYSPERINPGDKQHKVTNIVKVTSGSTPDIAEEIDALYKKIISAGTHKASSIKVAEAAKVIENAQRDINIAFVNELSLIFDRLGIDTMEVLQAARTKWNFLPFSPGLVGGHCIGVDPYYLTYKAESIGYHPEVILSGRRINDNMGAHVASKMVKFLANAGKPVKGSRVLVMGFTFKENCPDIRNTRVIDIVRELQEYGIEVDVFDPHADADEVMEEYGISLTPTVKEILYSGIILAVAHHSFKSVNVDDLAKNGTIIYDVKGLFPRDKVTARL